MTDIQAVTNRIDNTGLTADTDPMLWAVRAAGMVTSIVVSQDETDKDKIIDALEKLISVAPTELLMAAAIMGGALAAGKGNDTTDAAEVTL